MSSLEENRQAAADFFEQIWNQRDESAIDRFIALDAAGNDPKFGVGRESFRAQWKIWQAAFPDLHFDVREILAEEIPIFGICFGHQILGRALGFETYKLQFGHRGINQPVIDKRSGKVEITAHNHGFALKAPTDAGFSTVFGPGQVTHICLNDGVVEGIELLERGAFSVQYHPEAAAGPHDASYLFDQFVEMMNKYPRSVVAQ